MKSMMEKVRRPKTRPPEATPKEKRAWDVFTAMAAEWISTDGTVSALVISELDRLCAKGNPLAIRFKEQFSISSFKPRTAEEAPLPPPAPRRIRGLKWLHTPNRK